MSKDYILITSGEHKLIDFIPLFSNEITAVRDYFNPDWLYIAKEFDNEEWHAWLFEYDYINEGYKPFPEDEEFLSKTDTKVVLEKFTNPNFYVLTSISIEALRSIVKCIVSNLDIIVEDSFNDIVLPGKEFVEWVDEGLL